MNATEMLRRCGTIQLAAPEMYDALKALADACERVSDDDPACMAIREAHGPAMAALAKAEGK